MPAGFLAKSTRLPLPHGAPRFCGAHADARAMHTYATTYKYDLSHNEAAAPTSRFSMTCLC